ncbi:BapA/Bap/LapF family prefix-like domain-containing protein [Halomonas sp. 3D7M]|uniref:BapA/Bap/LapF family prefix-like domain-containing protein n=1 Tax=Halomonas sp. 3D7M TaxID=2742617 RepID=UPI001865FE34|nr:BapA prefix-like domain-containing protein [Halomonas sp. 3D7M]
MDNALIVITPKAGGDAVEIPRGSVVDLQEPSVVTISVGPEETAAFDRSGMDLIITLKSGEQIIIAGFFNAPGGERTELLLKDSTEVIWWGQYEIPWSGFAFSETQVAAGGLAQDSSNPSWAAALGMLGLVGIAAAASSSSSSDSDSDIWSLR